MRKFAFRLETVREFRETEEQAAKDAFLRARVERLQAEAAREAMREEMRGMVHFPRHQLADLREVEMRREAMADRIREQELVIQALLGDEELALREWHARRRDHEVLVKLRDKAREEWELEQLREEQSALDEWATMRAAREAKPPVVSAGVI